MFSRPSLRPPLFPPLLPVKIQRGINWTATIPPAVDSLLSMGNRTAEEISGDWRRIVDEFFLVGSTELQFVLRPPFKDGHIGSNDLIVTLNETLNAASLIFPLEDNSILVGKVGSLRVTPIPRGTVLCR